MLHGPEELMRGLGSRRTKVRVLVKTWGYMYPDRIKWDNILLVEISVWKKIRRKSGKVRDVRWRCNSDPARKREGEKARWKHPSVRSSGRKFWQSCWEVIEAEPGKGVPCLPRKALCLSIPTTPNHWWGALCEKLGFGAMQSWISKCSNRSPQSVKTQ